jgi:hypothetical protein
MRYVNLEHIGFILSPEGDSMRIPTHETVASIVRPLGEKPVSAGFVKWERGFPVCHGYSVSLGLHAAPEDSAELAAQLGIAGPAKGGVNRFIGFTAPARARPISDRLRAEARMARDFVKQLDAPTIHKALNKLADTMEEAGFTLDQQGTQR